MAPHLVCFDTTSIDVDGAGGHTIGRHGHSKNHRPDRPQMVVGVVLDADGQPVCRERWPGHTTDGNTVIPIVDRLKRLFHVRDVCVVADRGMISAETIAALDDRDSSYIFGVRMRSSTEARAVVGVEGRWTEGSPARTQRHDPAPLRVNEVGVGDHRSSWPSMRSTRARTGMTGRRSSRRGAKPGRTATTPWWGTRGLAGF